MKKEIKESKNPNAKRIVGLRHPMGGMIINCPYEEGYRCPICKSKSHPESLDWGEYNGFLWCLACNIDIPSALCMPDTIRAIDIYLATVRDAISRSKKLCPKKSKKKQLK